MEPSPNGYICCATPESQAQGTLQKRGPEDCKMQRNKEFAVRETLSPRNARSYTREALPTWLLNMDNINWHVNHVGAGAHKASTPDKALQARKECWAWRNRLPQLVSQYQVVGRENLHIEVILHGLRKLYLYLCSLISTYILYQQYRKRSYEWHWRFGGRKRKGGNDVTIS